MAPAAISFVEGPDHVYVYSNRAHDQALGGRPLLGRPIVDAVPELAGQGVIERFDQVFRIGETVHTETFAARFTRTEGGAPEQSWWRQTLVPWPDAQGAIRGVLNFAFEVTGELHAQQSAERLQARMARVLQLLPFPALVHREDGQVMLVSDSWLEVTGYDRDQLQTTADWVGLAYGDGGPTVAASIDDLYSIEGRAEEGEYEVRTASGAIRIWDFSSAAIGEDDQGRRLVISIAHDVTRRRASEAELRASEERLRLALAAGRLGTWVCDLDSGTVQLGGHEAELLGLPPSTARMSLEAYEALIVPDDRADATAALRGHRPADGEWTLDLRVARSNGDVRWLARAGKSLESGDGHRWVVGVTNDVTVERTQRQRLEALVKDRTAELEAFTSTVSHDLKAPLRVITGFADALQMDCGDRLDDAGRDYLARISERSSAMRSLIDDLLEYLRLGSQPVSTYAIDLGPAVRRALATLEPEVEASGAEIELEAGSWPSVMGDRVLLEGLLQNLIENALKFVAPGERPRVRIWQEATQDHVRLTVEDRGIGIEESKLTRIFEPFERLHGMESYAGTGIGLAIAQRAATRLGGSVGVQSELGEGSTFWLRLDRAPTPEAR